MTRQQNLEELTVQALRRLGDVLELQIRWQVEIVGHGSRLQIKVDETHRVGLPPAAGENESACHGKRGIADATKNWIEGNALGRPRSPVGFLGTGGTFTGKLEIGWACLPRQPVGNLQV